MIAKPFVSLRVPSWLILLGSVPFLFAGTPPTPAKITYPPLGWHVPLGSPFRTTLPNGLKVYIAEDRTLPYVEIVGYVRAGAIFDPADKEGLGSLSSRLMRTGGTEVYRADSLDRMLDLYSIKLSLSLGTSELQFSLSCLSDFTDTALAILSQVLFHPAFEQEKFDQERRIAIEGIRHRFDNPEPVLGAAFQKAMYAGGANSRLGTEKSLQSLSREDLKSFHAQVFRTQNIFLSAAGDFDRKKTIERLSRLFPSATGPVPDSLTNSIAVNSPVRCMIVHRPITQAYVRMGLPLVKRPHPDYYPLSVLNEILGGDGFTSRLGKKIRSDEGLTYSIRSDAGSNYAFPATFNITFHTKTETASLATVMALAQVDSIRNQGVTAEELANAKRVLVDALPSMFRSPGDIVQTYAWNEYYGRSDQHYAAYGDSINALTQEDIARVAKKYLTPTAFVYTVVADTAALFAADTLKGFSFRELKPRMVTSADSLSSLFVR